jgi:ABC-type branched-subunit amino acid transport system substrate-binding protein
LLTGIPAKRIYKDAGIVDAARHLTDQERQPPDRERIVAAMHRISHNGLTGQISFDAEGNLERPVFTIFQVKNQKWVAQKTIGAKP